MSTILLIAELAARSGSLDSRLCYYEGVGLLSPANRSLARYRLYDVADLDQFAFHRPNPQEPQLLRPELRLLTPCGEHAR